MREGIEAKTIHFVWLDKIELLPPLFRCCLAVWKNLYPSWEVKLWGKEQCQELIAKYPQYKNTFYNFKIRVMQADLIRYLIVYDCGGLYVDLDAFPLSCNFQELIEDSSDIFFVEYCGVWNTTWPPLNGIDMIPIANCFFYSPYPESPILKETLDLLVNNSLRPVSHESDILEITGPAHMSSVVTNRKWDKIKIVSKANTDKYFYHLGAGTWRSSIKNIRSSIKGIQTIYSYKIHLNIF